MGKIVASKRKGKHLNDAKSYIRKDISGTTYPDLSGCDFNFGDIAWVRTGSYSWWPAQVVDEKSVGPRIKPTKNAENDEVLIRQYGTYSYLYIDPVKNNEEFENTLRQNNGSMREMLEKSLEKDLCHIKSRKETKGYPPPCKEHVNAGASTNLEMWDKIKRTEETDSVTCVGASSVKDRGRGTNCTEEIEKARDVGCKIKNPWKHYVRRQQVRQRDRVGTLGDIKLKEDGKSGLNCSKKLDKASNFDPGNRKLQKNVNSNQPVTGKCRNGTPENLHEDEVREQRVKEKTGCETRQKQDGKLKTKQQDVMKLEQGVVKEPKVKEKPIQEKKQKLTEKARHEVLKYNNEMQDSERKSKQKDVSKHVKVDVHGYVKHAQVGRTPDASARRMKVMQNLALIAPSGSPFFKHGHVKGCTL